MKKTSLTLFVCVTVACGVRVERFSSETEFTAATGNTVALVRTVEIATAHGALPRNSRDKLAAGTRWRRAGRITEGEVYECADGVFMLDARHNHETYLVVSAGELVGLFVPVRHRFAPLKRPVPIQFQGR